MRSPRASARTRAGQPRACRSSPSCRSARCGCIAIVRQRTAGAGARRPEHAAGVSYHTWFRVGSRHEKKGKTGLAHLFEHLMFNETRKLAAGEFDRTDRGGGRRDQRRDLDRLDALSRRACPATELGHDRRARGRAHAEPGAARAAGALAKKKSWPTSGAIASTTTSKARSTSCMYATGVHAPPVPPPDDRLDEGHRGLHHRRLPRASIARTTRRTTRPWSWSATSTKPSCSR